jgi:hypothetical protein
MREGLSFLLGCLILVFCFAVLAFTVIDRYYTSRKCLGPGEVIAKGFNFNRQSMALDMPKDGYDNTAVIIKLKDRIIIIKIDPISWSRINPGESVFVDEFVGEYLSFSWGYEIKLLPPSS